ncbi:MAG: hypothetical protein K8T20_00210 [Planctomycetes bacterium]|nr:hypothetical protein [Planctomycetota bacterium]
MRSFVVAAFLTVAVAGCDQPPAPKPAAPAAPAAAVSASAPNRSPRQAWEARRRALLAADAETVWRSLCADSRAAKVREQEKVMEDLKRLPDESLTKALSPLGLAPGAFCRMSGEEFCLHMIRRGAKDPEAHKVFEGQEFVDSTMIDGRAVCRIGSHTGNAEYIVFSVEDGDWKLDEPETARRNGRTSTK